MLKSIVWSWILLYRNWAIRWPVYNVPHDRSLFLEEDSCFGISHKQHNKFVLSLCKYWGAVLYQVTGWDRLLCSRHIFISVSSRIKEFLLPENNLGSKRFLPVVWDKWGIFTDSLGEPVTWRLTYSNDLICGIGETASKHPSFPFEFPESEKLADKPQTWGKIRRILSKFATLTNNSSAFTSEFVKPKLRTTNNLSFLSRVSGKYDDRGANFVLVNSVVR